MSSQALLRLTLYVFAGIGVFSVLANLINGFGFLQTLAGVAMASALALFYKIGRDDGKNDCLLNYNPKAQQPDKQPSARQPQEPSL
ncbi:hypothetical protein VSS37_09425 [Candidatus Thiothrix sp. Deng01]|uniref:Uncharacterized protein n=2 Tax=Thiothrix TaxID=1030 RepID=A0A7L6ATG8_9GAMM|nr:hypothetical protein [Candidatus Thiothrix sp. Deng01]MEB4591197.1 hypothetical protein [Candidatus Thiothrix sp. Deng01]QLQ32412.1 MAG: hypothetical protein HZT40_13400 [Candidatus Thiothrix singaporensis]